MPVITHEKIVSLEKELCEYDGKTGLLTLSMSPEDIDILKENLANGNLNMIKFPIPGSDERMTYTKKQVNEICSFPGADYAYKVELDPNSPFPEDRVTVRLSYL